MSTVLSIAAVGGSGPKATVISFVKNDDGIRPWAWLPNEVAASLVPGMRLSVAQVGTGKVEETYTDRNTSEVIPLKVPKQQLFLGGNIEVLPPDQPVMEPVTVVFSDQAKAYADAYRAKQATATTAGPFDEEDL